MISWKIDDVVEMAMAIQIELSESHGFQCRAESQLWYNLYVNKGFSHNEGLCFVL